MLCSTESKERIKEKELEKVNDGRQNNSPELRVCGSGTVLPGNTWCHVNVKLCNSIVVMAWVLSS